MVETVQNIAVVLPFRDASRWLPESIASLRRQQGVALELIAVDDGSRDGSATLLQQLWEGCPWPMQLLRLPGAGVSSARNLGWRNSTAPLVAFLDADDICLPGRLASQAALLSTNSALLHCLCGWARLNASGQLLQQVQPWLEGAAFDAESVLRHKAVLPSAWMLKRHALVETDGFDEGLRHAEDVDLLLRLALADLQGCWLTEVACGYRVHDGNTSRQVKEQTRSLLWVVNRHVQRLSASAHNRSLQRELRYTTRAWAGWKAWAEGQDPLALELWRTALGISPLTPVRSWLHLAEQARRSCLREGLSWDQKTALASPVWQTLARDLVRRWPWWGKRELEGLRRDLLISLGPNPKASPWWPPHLLEQLDGTDVLQQLRAQLLHCCVQLMSEPVTQELPEALSAELRQALATIAHEWAMVCWREDAGATARQLELSLMLWPRPPAFSAYAELQRQQHPAGAAAIDQLAALFAPAGQQQTTKRGWQGRLPAPVAEDCRGPACRPCSGHVLAGWTHQPLAGGGYRWLQPCQSNDRERAWQVHQLTRGCCWIRTPRNVWGSTHGLGVASAEGIPMPTLCRRYPQPWPSCPHPPSTPEPPPAGSPEHIPGVVLAVADLSAEIYYHWLVEQLPRLGLAIDNLPEGIERQYLKVWHNGGCSRYVAEGLGQLLGLKREQLLDASLHPYIRADVLLVPDFCGQFGEAAPRAVRWLREHLLTKPTRALQVRRLWLSRGQSWRRPVYEEANTLRALDTFQLVRIDPGQLSLTEQASAVANANLVVLPHGGALANLIFARPGTRVLELHGPRYHPPYAHGLAQAASLRLASCMQPQQPPRLYQEWLYEAPILEPIVLEPMRIAECLADFLSTS